MYFVETEEVSECRWWANIIRFGGFAPFFCPYLGLYQIVSNEYDLVVCLCLCGGDLYALVTMCIRAPHSEISLCFTATLIKMQCFKWGICTATVTAPIKMYFVETEEVSECRWWAIIFRFGGLAPFFVLIWDYIKLY